MKKKSLSEFSLEELLQNKKTVKKNVISFGILWFIALTTMIILSKYNLFTIFLPLAFITIIPIYSPMGELNSEIKKRSSQSS
ncbi:hypothetical protein ACEN2I_03140 [Flavobacterium sp. W22_SRS_FK3]|uniref:hypothetical protein n=1 Tax=Flavobacterium sp. W22_SRS_FK3 TaxID=3240275 RepID=UPI003F8FF03B